MKTHLIIMEIRIFSEEVSTVGSGEICAAFGRIFGGIYGNSMER